MTAGVCESRQLKHGPLY